MTAQGRHGNAKLDCHEVVVGVVAGKLAGAGRSAGEIFLVEI
jgi:hypothetical protein